MLTATVYTQAAENVSETKRVTVPSVSMSILEAASVVSEQTCIPVCVENVAASNGHTQTPELNVCLNIRNQPIKRALDYMMSEYGSHKWQWSADRSIVNLIPMQSDGSDWWLDHSCPEFTLENVDVMGAMKELNMVLGVQDDPESRISCGWGGSIAGPSIEAIENHPLERLYNGRVRITAIIKSGTIREALNQIASSADRAWWSYREVYVDGKRTRMWITFFPTRPNMIYSSDAPEPAPLPVSKPLESKGSSLRISISQGLDLNKVIVVTGQYGNGLLLNRASKKLGHGFIQPISFSATKVKVLGYYPGYRLATVEVSNGYVPSQIPVTLKFVKLPTVPLTLRIVNSKGEPAANCKVAVRQSLQEHRYFGYADGAVSDYQAAPVASGVTDELGIWKTKVPKLSEDPLFPANEWKSSFSLMCESADGKGPIHSVHRYSGFL